VLAAGAAVGSHAAVMITAYVLLQRLVMQQRIANIEWRDLYRVGCIEGEGVLVDDQYGVPCEEQRSYS
jgi:hypothetical protein